MFENRSVTGKLQTSIALCVWLLSAGVPASQAANKPQSTAAPNAATGISKPASAAKRPIKDKWALVIGIGNFANPSLNLKFPAKDATDFRNFLVNEAHFAPDHVQLLTDSAATRVNILSLLGDKWLPRVAYPDDLVVIYISTHGSPSALDVDGVNYLLAHDTDPDNLYATGLPLQDLIRMIKARVHSDRVLIVLDACHSGAASADTKGLHRTAGINANAVAQGTGQLVITSSGPDQVSWESKTTDNGVFTRHLISALRKNASATTLGNAFNDMRDKVQAEVLRDRGVMQTPVLKSKWDGDDLIIAVKPVAPHPSIEPAVQTTPPAPAATQPALGGSTAGSGKLSGPNPLLTTPPIDLLTAGLGDFTLAMADSNFRDAEKHLKTLLASPLARQPESKACLLMAEGDLATEKRDYKKAQNCYEQAQAVAETLGANHAYKAQALDKLSNLYWKQNKFAEAEKPLQKLIELMSATMGDHTDVSDKLSLLQLYYEQQGKNEAAAQIDEQIARMKVRIFSSRGK